MAVWWKTRSSLTRISRFSRSRICSSERARAASTPDFASTSGERGHGQTGLLESALDGGAGLLLILLQHQLVAGQTHILAFHYDLFFLRQNGVDQERRRIRQLAAAQILLGDARQQGVLPVKLADRARAASRARPGTRRDPRTRACGCFEHDHRRVRRRSFDLALPAGPCAPPVRPCPCRISIPAPASRCVRPRSLPPARAAARLPWRSAFAIPHAAGVQHHAPADRHHRRKHADDKAVSGQQQRRLAQHDAGPGALAGLQRRRAVEQPHLRFDLRRARMKVYGRAMLQRLGRGQQFEARNPPA